MPPHLAENKISDNDDEKGAEGGKTFPTLARSERSQPASARAPLGVLSLPHRSTFFLQSKCAKVP